MKNTQRVLKVGVTKIRCQGTWRRHRWQKDGVCKRCGDRRGTGERSQQRGRGWVAVANLFNGAAWLRRKKPEERSCEG